MKNLGKKRNLTVLIITLVIVLSVIISMSLLSTTVHGAATVDYKIQSDWGSGAVINITIKNTSSEKINGWTTTWTFSGNQKINSMWDGKYTQNGNSVKVTNESWNSNISPNSSLSFGFQISYSGTNSIPSNISFNGSSSSVNPTQTIVKTATPKVTTTAQTTPKVTDNNSTSTNNEVTRSGNTWTAKVKGSTVYSGSRMFDAVNAACNKAGNGAAIKIKNSGDSGNDGGNVYAIKPLEGQTLDFSGCTVNCNSSGDLAVAVYAKNRNNITIKNLKVKGNPRYGVWFLGCSNLTLTNITMDLNKNNPVGLGIRVDGKDRATKNLKINGTTTINGSKGHGIETYTIDGVEIGDVKVTNTGGCGVILNDSKNCKVGVVTGDKNCPDGGYATFRVANNNGKTYCKGVYSRNSGRGFFSVSGSKDCTIGWVDIKNTRSHGIFLENASNTIIESGNVSSGNPNVQHVKCSNVKTKVNGKTYTSNDGKW